jgi:hypothetical protein
VTSREFWDCDYGEEQRKQPSTTGKWTTVQEARIRIVNYLGDRVTPPFRRYEEDEIERIINDALAAERGRHWEPTETANELWREKAIELEKQLAAEQQRTQSIETCNAINEELTNLLASCQQQQESLVTTLKVIHKISRDPVVTEICEAELSFNK